MSASALVVTERITLPAGDLHWTAVRASGPGGQNVNKVASKVELRFDLEASAALDVETKNRLRALSGVKLAANGEVVVTSQRTRDQTKNLDDAREKLKGLIVRALHRPAVRRATRPSRSRVRARLDDKRKISEKKASRQSSNE